MILDVDEKTAADLEAMLAEWRMRRTTVLAPRLGGRRERGTGGGGLSIPPPSEQFQKLDAVTGNTIGWRMVEIHP